MSLKPGDYCGYAFLIAALPVILFLSYTVAPSGEGVGTHTGLGLPPCGFYSTFEKPCPSCGMTTSFALMVRGRVLQAVKTQPAGVFLFLTALAVWSTIPYHLYRRKPLLELLELPYLLPVLLANIVVILVVWTLRLLF